jgi:hypothetical protein
MANQLRDAQKRIICNYVGPLYFTVQEYHLGL